MLGKVSKFNFCGPRFSHSLTKSNNIVCDFCRSLAELSRLSKKPYIVIRYHSQIVVMAFCDMPQKSQKQLTNISLKQIVALSGEF